jgi:molecular chaperone Hsp33
MKERNNNDCLQRFLFEKHHVRGVIIRLKASYQKALEQHEYSSPAKKYLGQALCAAGLLSATIKFEGRLTLQVQGKNELKLLLAQSNHEQDLRGLALEEGQLAEVFSEAVGPGHLLINIDQKDAKERYQAVTEIVGDSLASTIDHYFIQSEQLATRLWLFANENEAAGILLQALPDNVDEPVFWQHVETLTETVTEAELLELPSEELLHRLFHEEDVRLFDSSPVAFKCSCSTEKMEAVIMQLGQEEAEGILKEQGAIKAKCDFCNRSYEFDAVDVAKIFATGNKVEPSETEQ